MSADGTSMPPSVIRSRGRDITPTGEQLDEARGWVSDCTWAETELYGIDPSVDFTDAEIVRGVDAHYDGGWAMFVNASREPDIEVGS